MGFFAHPQKGIFGGLEGEVLRDWSLCQGLNDRRHVNDFWRLGELVASTEINWWSFCGRARRRCAASAPIPPQ